MLSCLHGKAARLSSAHRWPSITSADKRPASRAGKRVLSVCLDPRMGSSYGSLRLIPNTTTQALGEEAVNLLLTKHGLNRSA